MRLPTPAPCPGAPPCPALRPPPPPPRSPLDTDSSIAGDAELGLWGEDELLPAVSPWASVADSGSSSDVGNKRCGAGRG
jgi:hypothetical protein